MSAPRTPKVHHRFANRRGKLHGGLALFRVLGSITLRREVVMQLSEQELRGELARRERLAKERGRMGMLARLMDALAYVVIEATRAP